jgi:hypothetical protein
MLNQIEKNKLNEVLSKDPSALTESERGFLRARKGYLNEFRIKKYKAILEVKPAKKK